MFFRKKITKPRVISWTTPGGSYNRLADEALKAEHTLIAGYTGCGKSTFIRAIMQAILVKETPADAKLVIIDPKQTDLWEYRSLPHVLRYADNLDSVNEALGCAVSVMAERTGIRRARREEVFSGPALYVIIDELNPMLTDRDRKRRACTAFYIEQLVSLGRASNVHVIAATQNPNKATIPANISDNCTCRFGLHCMTAIQSRQIILKGGCEMLPKHGQTLAIIDGELGHYVLPYVKMDEVRPLIRYWTSGECRS